MIKVPLPGTPGLFYERCAFLLPYRSYTLSHAYVAERGQQGNARRGASFCPVSLFFILMSGFLYNFQKTPNHLPSLGVQTFSFSKKSELF